MRVLIFLAAIAWFGAAFSAEPRRFGPNEGEVLEVDREAREIAIRHGRLPELDMDPMSMIFIVADPSVLEGLKKGDRVKFKAGLVGGRFAVIAISKIR